MNVPPQPRVSSDNTQPSSAVMTQPHMGIGTGDMSGAWVPAALGCSPRHKAQANKPCDNRLGVWNDKAKALVTSVKMGRLLAKPKPKFWSKPWPKPYPMPSPNPCPESDRHLDERGEGPAGELLDGLARVGDASEERSGDGAKPRRVRL